MALLTPVAVLALVLGVESVVAGRRDYLPADSAPDYTGDYGPSGGTPVHLVVLGDSTAAGVGVREARETVAGRLAAGLASDGRRVRLDTVAVSGARSADLDGQVDLVLALRPDLVLVLIGANDATHGVRPGTVAGRVRAAVRRLVDAGAAVVVGTCPDIGAARALARPLRDVTGWYARRVADAEIDAVRDAGGVPVDLYAETGSAFRADPRTLSSDRFHPSARGYRLWADALLPSVIKAARPSPR